MHIKLKLNQRGDTIVEVMIATVIIGLVLVISYVAVNYSTSDEQASQERSEAIQLLQNQIEDLRYIATNSLSTPPTGPNAFCINGTSTISMQFSPFTQATNLSTLSPPAVAAGCIMTSPNSQPQFFVEIVDTGGTTLPNGTTLPADTFEATAVWQSARGGNDTASIAYRINF